MVPACPVAEKAQVGGMATGSLEWVLPAAEEEELPSQGMAHSLMGPKDIS